jgi:hypothetical protein
MAVGGDDPEAQHIGPLAGPIGAARFGSRNHETGVAHDRVGELQRGAGRAGQPQRERRHRLVEGEDELLRRGCEDGVIGRLGGDQRRMCECRRGRERRDEQG